MYIILIAAVLCGVATLIHVSKKYRHQNTSTRVEAQKESRQSRFAAFRGFPVVEGPEERAEFEMKNLEYIDLLEGREGYEVETLIHLAKIHNADFSLADGLYMLEHQEEIPIEMRGESLIMLAATILRDRSGNPHIAFLVWCSGCRWNLEFMEIRDTCFSGRGLFFPRFKKSTR